MDPENPWQPNSAGRHLAPLDAYKDVVVRLFPTLPRRVLDNWYISPVDALALGYFLEHHPRKVIVLEVGAFVGASAFYFASHTKVSKVISIDPNPTVSELVAGSDGWDGSLDLEALENLRVLDVARTALAEFDDEREKIQFREGVVGGARVGVVSTSLEDPNKVDVPVVDPSEDASLVAFVAGLHTREGVRADLSAIFARNPHAIALLDDCRHARGPFVQAGVVDFMEQTEGEYHFRLLGDLGPGLARSNLGIVYPASSESETGSVLTEVSQVFSQRLDPLRLLNREEALIETVNRTKQQLSRIRENNTELGARVSQLEKRNSRLQARASRLEEKISKLQARASRLKERNAELAAQHSSRRHGLVAAVASRASRIPGLRSLARRDTRG